QGEFAKGIAFARRGRAKRSPGSFAERSGAALEERPLCPGVEKRSGADERVVTFTGEEVIGAGPSVEEIVAASSDEVVVAGAAEDFVVAGTAVELVVAGAAKEA